MGTKFQLSRLTFIFTNCYQLSSGVDCWLKVLLEIFNFSFYAHSKGDMHAKIQLS